MWRIDIKLAPREQTKTQTALCPNQLGWSKSSGSRKSLRASIRPSGLRTTKPEVGTEVRMRDGAPTVGHVHGCRRVFRI